MQSSASVSIAEGLDVRFGSEKGLYGTIEDIPLIAQKSHYRRMELLDGLGIGDMQDKVCVDFGTGSWGFAGIYPRLHHCKFAYGLDISPTALSISRKLSSECRFPYGSRYDYLQSDGLDLPLPDESVDILFSGESIEHVRLPMRFLSECHRVLKPSGQIVITTPNRDALPYWLQNDQYCVGPEHFWLFNLEELEAAVSEFFDIEERLGFNGSFYRDLDKTVTDPAAAEQWAGLYKDQPQHATGIILRGVRKPVPKRNLYAMRVIDPSQISVTGPSQRLDLEFGLKGSMIDNKSANIKFMCPPCDGLVMHFWTHAWSGFARVQCGDTVREYNLFSHDPGWLPVHFKLNSNRALHVRIDATERKDDRARANQVIFFEACVYQG